MRVLHIVPRWSHGGPVTSILVEAEIAHRGESGVRHRVLTLERGGSAAKVREAMLHGLRLSAAPNAGDEEALIQDADVVVLHFWNTPSVWKFLDRCRNQPMRWILYCRVNGMHRPQRLPPVLAVNASHVVLTSPHLQASIDHDRVTVLPAVARLPEVAARPPNRDSASIVHVGTLNVFKLSPDFVPLHGGISSPRNPVHIAGSGGDEQRFQAEAEAMGIANEFKWTGFSLDVPSMFEGASIFSHPVSAFSYASSDRVIQESQAAGLPVMVQRGAPVAHLIREGITGILADDLVDFRKKLLAIASGQCTLPDRETVRAAALEDHDPRRKCGVLNGIYRGVADGPARPLDHGFDTLEPWIDFQVGDIAEIVDARRPSLAALRDDRILLAHQRWGCEGGLAQYINVFPDLAGKFGLA